MIEVHAKYRDTASKDKIVYSVDYVNVYTIRFRDNAGNYLTVGYDRFKNDFEKVQ